MTHPARSRVAPSRSDRSALEGRLGAVVAAATAATATAGLGLAMTTLPRSGPYCRVGCVVDYPYTDGAAVFVPRDYLWVYPALLLALLVVVLAGCVHDRLPPERRAWGRLGYAFAVMAATVLSLDYVVQLTVLQPALLRDRTEGLAPWSSYHPFGLFVAFENLGYLVLNLAFAAWAGGLLLSGERLERVAGRIFLGGAVLTIAAAIYYPVRYGAQLDYRFEVAAILISWSALIAAPTLLAVTWSGRRPAGRSNG